MINYSIIIPHYNIPYLLEKLLLTTPYDKEDAEVIVVDDRSDRDLDKLFDLKHRFEDRGVKFFRNNSGKKGAGTCRNVGMKHATGKWLIFADADDFFADGFYDTISEYKDSHADVIFFTAESIDIKTGEPSYRHLTYNNTVRNYIENANHENELNLRQGAVNPWCKMVKRSFAEKKSIRFNETLVANDVRFSTEVGLYAGEIKAVDKAIYILTCREGSLTRSFNKEIYMIRNRVFAERCRLLKKNLSRTDWRLLDISGHNRLIAMIEEGYSFNDVINSAVFFLLNGIRPINLRKINVRTLFRTVKVMVNERKGISEKGID